jgi:prepilin-type N-terminal cleavage/methylation domain-containing protein
VTFKGAKSGAGFTLLEVLIALTVLAIGAALTLSVISGALGNIRKVRLRTNMVQHAETVMELALLDESVKGPTTLTGDFEDGTRWSVVVSDFEMPVQQPLPDALQRLLPIKLLSYTVEILGPGSTRPDLRFYTLKLVPAQPLGMQAP